MVDAVKSENLDALVRAAERAKAAGEPDAPALLVYAYSAANQATSAEVAVKGLEQSSPSDPNSVALKKLALAEYAQATGHKDDADLGYRALGTYMKNHKLTLDLVGEARKRHRAAG